jgi:2-polyprenyl-3-methyl-5-hydroxy-6-metoxy-1,4-benzoquinol methylase
MKDPPASITSSDELLASQPNRFDNLHVDAAQLFRTFPPHRDESVAKVWCGQLARFYSTSFLPLPERHAIWSLLRRLDLDQAWFERFRIYWGRVLGGRPLWGVQDFHFLRSIYRMRFQRGRNLPELAAASAHLDAWQQPPLLSHLFHSVYKESLFTTLDLLAHLRRARRPVRRLLEFGCGTGPVATSVCEFFRPAGMTLLLADIETVSFHYAAWKFASFPNVRPIRLRPEDEFQLQLDEPVDAIFCMTVFEHLNNPLETIASFRRLLNPGGVLVFDYIKSEAMGLDSSRGLADRAEVLGFIGRNFKVLHGRLDPERSIGTTVVLAK